jgi:transcriptional regulator with XRE-family HTH domain
MDSMDSSELYGRVGVLIKNGRRQRGLSQTELAATLGMSRASLANIETGRQGLLLHHLYRIATSLEVDVGTLMPPQADLALSAPEIEGLPLPAHLKPEQRAQIARMIRAETTTSTRHKDNRNARSATRQRR